jgi:quinoprotein glucose dehydrogenase
MRHLLSQATLRAAVLLAAALGTVGAASLGPRPPVDDEESQWSSYGGDPGGSRHTTLAQIDRNNVRDLRIAWTYRTGELGAGFARADRLAFEATPILVRGSLFLSTPTNIVIALDPATGKERWRYDPKIDRALHYSEATSRGVSSWIDPTADPAVPCSHRILMGTLDARLIALDGRTGRLCASFGNRGIVDTTQGVRLTERGSYLLTSPPAIYRDLAIIGSAIGDNRAVELERGIVRAFDIRSGALVWSWDPIPTTDREAAQQGWSPQAAKLTGAANAWSVLSVDPGRGLVFVPTGSASPDLYGGERAGDNSHANSLVALRADTGKLVWHRQLVHHDLWDYDLAAQPMLIDIERDNKSIPAVVQATKTGMLFVFDRETGEPVFEIVERPVPQSDVAGEAAAPTQPFPATPSLVSHAAVTPQDAWGLTFYDRGKCRELIEQYRSEGIFTPPSLKGTILSPSYVGGVNWGSLAFDSERQLVIAAVNNVPMVVTLIPREELPSMRDSGAWPDSDFANQRGTPYGLRRELLASPLGLPCTAPPWGTLAAVDLKRNAIRWQVMLGSTRDMTPWFVPGRTIGMPNMGGPIVTNGGLAFVAAATDNYLRAFDVDTGRELWKGRLPAGGQATPMTYEVNGRQFVVIAAGGHARLGTKQGDHVVAFALPE